MGRCTKVVALLLVLCCVDRCLSASCVVDSFTVKQDFDPKRYAGKWYALQKKDPEGLFLQDNISAEYTIDDDGTMSASSKGRVTLFGLKAAGLCSRWVPLRFLLTCSWRFCSAGDNYWIIDTDYDNYALTYSCRTLRDDGSCDDGYSIVFSRNPRGLPPAIQRRLRQKQDDVCMGGQFQPVLQSGAC
ncbi:hypothetical protein CRUP_036194 [Coryphaenoides rupestris]|nr:hypothetical protein CRUP_036194 [Coryphaenoides rupestris]